MTSSVAERKPRSRRLLIGTWVLVAECALRGSSFALRDPQQPILALASAASPAVLAVSGVLIGLSAARLPARWQNVVGAAGHLGALATLLIYLLALLAGSVFMGSTWSTSGLVVFAGLAHLARLRGHGLDLQEGGFGAGRDRHRRDHHRRRDRDRGGAGGDRPGQEGVGT